MTRILIVEDEESYREPLVYQLTREGYDVSAAATGEEGLELFTKGGIDLVLLDLMLPGLDGKARKSTRSSALKSARTTTSPNRIPSVSCWHASARCCAATRWSPNPEKPPTTIFRSYAATFP